MRYVRATVDIDSGEIIAVQEQGVPFEGAGVVHDNIVTRTIDVGAVADADVPTESGFARWLHARLVFDQQADAIVPRAAAAHEMPPIMRTPTALVDVLAHLSGDRYALAPAIIDDLRATLAARDDVPVRVLSKLGMRTDELRALPRMRAHEHARVVARADAMAAAVALAQQHQHNADLEARIARRLGRGDQQGNDKKGTP